MTMPSATIKGYLTNYQMIPGSASSATVDMSEATTGTAATVGDFVFIYANASGSLTTANTPGPPTGFTELVSWQAMGTSTTTTWALYVKRRATGETNYTLPQLNANRASNVFYHVFWVAGADAADISSWTIGSLNTRAASGGTVNTIGLSVTTSVADCIAFGFGVERTTAAETAANLTVSGTSWTKQLALIGQAASNGTITIASKPMVSAGATGNVTFTTINTQATNGAALQVVIPPAATTPTIPTTVTGQIWDGTQIVEGRWFVKKVGTGVSGVAGLSYAGLVCPGSPSIDAMLAEPYAFHIAHRGGSANYPEMSLHGYTQSAISGYDALEVSVARTSDGRWFGLHDASLDRTSLGTGGGSGTTLVASTMTWAAVQGYDILPATAAPVNSNHKPYMELEELLDAYLKSHVIFVDVKYALSFRAELISILKNFSDWDTKIVAKYVPGNSNVSWLADARAAGFTTNAMFYAANDFTTYHPQADILGMEYTAAQGVWDSILALGKPVIGHICPTTAAVTTAVGKGASGVMVSGVVQTRRVPGL